MVNHLSELVASLDARRIHDGAVRLLAEVGMKVPSPRLRQRIADSALKAIDGRVLIDPERTRAFMERQRSEAAPEQQELPVRLHPGSHLEHVGAAPMPVMGVTAPLDWTAAWAQAVAEAVGTAIVLEALGTERGHALAALYAADMHTGGLASGSPEHVLCTLTEAKVNSEVLGNRRRCAKALNNGLVEQPNRCAG